METSEKVGTVKMKPLYAIKKISEEFSIDKVIGGGILKRYQTVVDNAIRNKTIETKTAINTEKDTAMFGQEVLEELGIVKDKAGEYVEKDSQEEEILL